jgi:hypothetical protein
MEDDDPPEVVVFREGDDGIWKAGAESSDIV